MTIAVDWDDNSIIQEPSSKILFCTLRGVEIAEVNTCPGTSKSAIMYLSIENFTCPILKNR